MACVFITGANRGIGKTILNKFAENHFDIVVSTRKQYPEFEEYCKNLAAKENVLINHVYMDLSDKDSINEGLKVFSQLKIVPNVLVNNAGMFHEKILLMSNIDEIRNVFQINYFSILQITQKIAKMMMRTGGVIVNVSSIASLTSQPLGSAYGASKAALNTLTRSLAQELASFNIRVNAVAPGGIETEMYDKLDDSSRKTVLDSTAQKRLAKPEEIANVVYFLASNDASFINGQILRVDGGLKF